MKGRILDKKRIWTYLYFFLILVCWNTSVKAVPMVIDTSQQAGKVDLEENGIKSDPEAFIDYLKTDFRRGSLESMSVLGRKIIQVKPKDIELQSLYGIYLATRGAIAEAKEIYHTIPTDERTGLFPYLAEAMIEFKQKNYSRAAAVCEKAISSAPDHPYPRLLMGLILYEQGNHEAAMENFQKAVEKESDFLPGYINAGNMAFLLKEYGQAAGFFQDALRLYPDSFNAHFGLGQVYAAAGRTGDALKAIEASYRLQPENGEVLRNLGDLQFRIGQYKNALTTGREMVRLSVDGGHYLTGAASLQLGDIDTALNQLSQSKAHDVNTAYLIGTALIAKGKYEEGLAKMEQVLKEEPRHFGAYASRIVLRFYLNRPISDTDLDNSWDTESKKFMHFVAGGITAAEGRWETTTETWEEARGMVPGFSLIGLNKEILKNGTNQNEIKYMVLGVLFYLRGLEQYALTQFEEALKINEVSILSNYWAGLVYLKEKKVENALRHLQISVETAPKFFSALYELGNVALMMNDSNLAEHYFQKAYSIKKDPSIPYRLGVWFDRSGQFEKAEFYYSAHVADFPDLFTGYNQLAWLYAKHGVKLDKALILAEKANNLLPNNPLILDTIGWIYFQKKDYSNALKFTQKAYKLTNQIPSILYHLGAIYHARDELISAKTYLTSALEISQDFEEAGKAKNLLNRIRR